MTTTDINEIAKQLISPKEHLDYMLRVISVNDTFDENIVLNSSMDIKSDIMQFIYNSSKRRKQR